MISFILPIQIILSLFIFFAVSRVFLRFREGSISAHSFLFWVLLFVLATVGVFNPKLTTEVAKFLGIGRGSDVVIYFSIIFLFYLIFRTNVLIENLHHEITKIIREIAIKDHENKKKS